MDDTSHYKTEGDINLGEERKAWNANLKHENTKEILNRDAHVFMHQALSSPCLDVIKSSHGIYIKTLSGKTYMDFHGNNVHQLGYKNEFILNRIKSQMDELAFCPRRFTNEPIVELSERLIQLTNNELQRVLYSPSGTTAISIALKIARIVTGKYKTIATYDSFHGATLESISMGGEQVFKEGLGPLMIGSIHVPPIDSFQGIWYKKGDPFPDRAYAEYIGYIMEKEGDIGALVLETFRSTVVQLPSPHFWKKIRELCNKHEVLLILDEIPIAMGRTGKMFAYEHTGITPDILVLGKGLGAGIIPFAAVLCKEEHNIASNISLGHFTHEKSPLGAAATLAALDFMKDHQILEKTNFLGNIFQHKLMNLKSNYFIIGDVRGIGLLWALEIINPKSTSVKANELATEIMYHCFEKGLSIKVSNGHILSLYPSLIITEEEMNLAIQILEESIQLATKRLIKNEQ